LLNNKKITYLSKLNNNRKNKIKFKFKLNNKFTKFLIINKNWPKNKIIIRKVKLFKNKKLK